MANQNLEPLGESVFDFLSSVRRRPGLYFGETSLSRLHAYLLGYEAGVAKCGKSFAGAVQFHSFHDWVAAEFGFSSSTSGWCKMIQSKAESDEKAFHLFFELLDRFCQEKGITR